MAEDTTEKIQRVKKMSKWRERERYIVENKGEKEEWECRESER